ncbi:MAG TPA: cation:proton antiporter [Methanoregulaceae archaeon]|nr:cation:proton antiporter [Methanoregulaceae archaeon]
MSATLAYSIEFQMTLLLFVALAGYLLATRINQSAVVGEILVGLIVGPSVLGLITYTDFVQTLAGLGAIILLFVIGFEFKLSDLMDVRYGIIGLVGIIIPWIGGYYLSLLFGFDFGSAIFVGTALTATSIAITANVLKEIGVLHTDVAKAIISTAVIDDVLSLVALAITADVVSGTFSIFNIALILAKEIAFILIAGAIGVYVLAPILRNMDKTKIAKVYPELVFITALAIAFFYATCAELIGTSGIIGAFIAGVALGSVELEHSKSIHESTEPLYIIFASIFFISLGILVDIHTITQETLLFLVLLTIVAIITKVIGCGLPARLLGMSWRDSMILGFGMSPRGEVAMIVALLGLSQNLITQDIFAVIVMMSLLTTVFTPIIYRKWFFRDTAPA